MSNVSLLPLPRGWSMRLDAAGRIVRVDAAWARAMGWAPEALVGAAIADLLSEPEAHRFAGTLGPLKDRGAGKATVELSLPGISPAAVELAVLKGEGAGVVEVTLVNAAPLDGDEVGSGGLPAPDVSRAVFEQAFEPLVVVGAEGEVLQINPAAADFLGGTRAELIGLTVDALIAPPAGHRTARSALRRAVADGSLRIEAPSRWHGSEGPLIEWRIASLRTSLAGPGMCLVSPRDVSQERQREARELYLAKHDQLTGLCNRKAFQSALNVALERWRAGEGRAPTVALLNLDSFREINAAFGNQVGDEALRIVAERLSQTVRETDIVARFSGDVFALLLESVDPAGGRELARRLLDAVAEPIALTGQDVCLTGCLGMASAADGVDDQEPVFRAEAALNDARHRGRDACVLYSDSVVAHGPARIRLSGELRRALQLDQFELLYQPQVVAGTGDVVGMEALIRWHHPERGMVAPAEFIPVLEESSLIVQVGDWVLRQACEDLKRLADAGFDGLRVAVNISPRQLEEPGFVDRLEALLNEHGLRPGTLELELTESLFMSPLGEGPGILDHIVDLGLRLAVDDFGTGYSALAYLKRFPVHCLKLDQSFVRGLGQSREDTAIVTAVCAMATQLGMDMVAEGVETRDQVDFLSGLPGAVAQGFHFARPMPLGALMGRMRQEREAVRLAC